MNERRKECNELAKQLFVHNSDLNHTAAMNAAEDFMAALYGLYWEEEPQEQPTPAPATTGNPDATISIVEYKGEKWVRVQALGEDFIIAPKDLDGGKDDFDYDAAMKRLKELNLDTFDKKQGLIIAIYTEQINAALVECGGDKFAADIYVSKELWKPVGSSADCSGYRTWFFDGSFGCFHRNARCYGGFRSRPVLAYSLS